MFLYIVAFILFMNLAWYMISDYWLRHDLQKKPLAKKYARISLVLWMALIALPFIGLFINTSNSLDFNIWTWLATLYIWMALIFVWMPMLLVLGVLTWLSIKAYDYYKSNTMLIEHQTGTNENKLSRRQLIRVGLVAAPPLLTMAGLGMSAISKYRLEVRKVDIPVKNLPAELEGYTITQLSDTHIGRLTSPERVQRTVEVANKLNSNLTVVTGDILDNDIDFIDDMVDVLKGLQAEQGVYLCIGNHDKMYDANKWIKSVRSKGFNLLLDQASLIDTGTSVPIQLLGIDFSYQAQQDAINLRKALNDVTAPPGSLPILIAHNPDAFDTAVAAGIPLTIAGHTHGGQIALRIGEHYEFFNAGEYLFKYIKGSYHKPTGESLFVHSGSGDWFPLRVGVPAEVVQLRLTQA